VKTAERLRVAAGRLTLPGLHQDLRLSMSFGVSAYPRDRVKDADDLIREADQALYRAKRSGRNRVEVMRG
jgi:diguanylate cyclase (GGDEF)-like protein